MELAYLRGLRTCYFHSSISYLRKEHKWCSNNLYLYILLMVKDLSFLLFFFGTVGVPCCSVYIHYLELSYKRNYFAAKSPTQICRLSWSTQSKQSKHLKARSGTRVSDSFGSHNLGSLWVTVLARTQCHLSPSPHCIWSDRCHYQTAHISLGCMSMTCITWPKCHRTAYHMFSWKVWSALLLDQVPSELSAAGAERGVRFLQLRNWSLPDDPF